MRIQAIVELVSLATFHQYVYCNRERCGLSINNATCSAVDTTCIRRMIFLYIVICQLLVLMLCSLMTCRFTQDEVYLVDALSQS